MNKKDVIDIVTDQRKRSSRGLSAQYDNNTACWAFYNADRMNYTDTVQFSNELGLKKKALVNFNKVQPIIDAVVGFAAQNRRQAKLAAHLPNDERQNLFSKNMNAIYKYTRENTNADYLETDQDRDMFVCGVGLTETDLSYIIGNATTMPNGEIVKMRIAPDCAGWDATAKQKNLLDARWMYYWQDYDLKDALDLFQGSTVENFGSAPAMGDDQRGFVYNPFGGLYDKIKADNSVEWSSSAKQRVRVYNHQWFTYETFYRAENPLYLIDDLDTARYAQARMEIVAGELEERLNGPENIETRDIFAFDPAAQNLTFDGATKARLVEEFGELIRPISFKRKVFHTAVYSGDHVFSHFRSISQQGFSIKAKTGVYNESARIWVGMVNAMMEPQRYYNKSLTELMFTIAANSKGGVLAEEDAVEDVAEFEANYARTDAVVIVRSGALSSGKIQDKSRPAIPTGLESIVTLSEQGINSAGVDASFMGDLRGGEEQAGVLYKRRIRQIISKFAHFFDSISLYQKEDARLCIDLIRVWVQNNQGEWLRLTGPDGADEFMQLSEDMLAGEYDVSIQEAPQTPEDERESAVLLMSTGDKLLSLGDSAGKMFYVEALAKLPIDGDARNRLSQALQGQPDQSAQLMAQMQAMQAELEQYKALVQSGELDKTKSETEKNRASAMETMSRIPLNEQKVPLTNAQTVKTLEEAEATSVNKEVAAIKPAMDHERANADRDERMFMNANRPNN